MPRPILRFSLVALSFCFGIACSADRTGDVGAPCKSAEDCADGLICDEHDGQSSCQEAHDHDDGDDGEHEHDTGDGHATEHEHGTGDGHETDGERSER